MAGERDEAAAIRQKRREDRGFGGKNHVIATCWRRLTTNEPGLH
ncbi:hypothetical protein [Hoeflea marina]|nr:hypothetical protein [Hoeflea marina]